MTEETTGPGPSEWAEWSRQLHTDGVVTLTVGRRTIVQVDRDGVALRNTQPQIPWVDIGMAIGEPGSHVPPREPYFLSIAVSDRWYHAYRATSHGDRVVPDGPTPNSESMDEWATVSFTSWKQVAIEAFGDWLSHEAIHRAPLPERLMLSPLDSGPVHDRDTGRPVPLDRLSVSASLRTDLTAWGADGWRAAQQGVSDAEMDSRWDTGRPLAERLSRETARPARVWEDWPGAT